MKAAIKVVLILVACLAAYFGFWHYQYDRAQAAANDFCGSVAVGTDIAAAIPRVEALGGVRHGFQEQEARYIVVFRGPIFNAFICELTLTAGKVVSNRVRPDGD
jgi:hypothetical protein